VRRCVVRCLVRRLISRFVTVFVLFLLKVSISQLQIQSMIWTSMLQMRKHNYFGDFDFIILFVGILSFYAINLADLSLFADSSLMFLEMFVLICSINLNEWISFYFCQKNKTSQTENRWARKLQNKPDLKRWNLKVTLVRFFRLNLFFFFLLILYKTLIFINQIPHFFTHSCGRRQKNSRDDH